MKHIRLQRLGLLIQRVGGDGSVSLVPCCGNQPLKMSCKSHVNANDKRNSANEIVKCHLVRRWTQCLKLKARTCFGYFL